MGAGAPAAPPNGLAPETLDQVVSALRDAGTGSAAEIGEACGISRGSVRRYLEHLVDTGRAEDRIAAARRYPDEPLAFLSDRDLFGDLIDDERFTTAYRAHLEALHTDGARATVDALEQRDR